MRIAMHAMRRCNATPLVATVATTIIRSAAEFIGFEIARMGLHRHSACSRDCGVLWQHESEEPTADFSATSQTLQIHRIAAALQKALVRPTAAAINPSTPFHARMRSIRCAAVV